MSIIARDWLPCTGVPAIAQSYIGAEVLRVSVTIVMDTFTEKPQRSVHTVTRLQLESLRQPWV